MGFFNWSAPIIHRFGQRWTAEDVTSIAAVLAPFLAADDANLLDVGGGSGGLAIRLADALQREVTVLDPTPELLARVPDHPLVRKLLGVAEEMPLADASVDAVVITDAFHHFRDQGAAVDDIARILRPGGALLVHDLEPRGWMRLVVVAEKLLGEPGAFLERDAMCRFMRAHDLEGECESLGGYQYRFLGVRRS